jgi:hypothetical protein
VFCLQIWKQWTSLPPSAFWLLDVARWSAITNPTGSSKTLENLYHNRRRHKISSLSQALSTPNLTKSTLRGKDGGSNKLDRNK